MARVDRSVVGGDMSEDDVLGGGDRFEYDALLLLSPWLTPLSTPPFTFFRFLVVHTMPVPVTSDDKYVGDARGIERLFSRAPNTTL